MSKSGAFNKYLGFLWVTFQRPIGIPMANIEATHQISNGIHSISHLTSRNPVFRHDILVNVSQLIFSITQSNWVILKTNWAIHKMNWVILKMFWGTFLVLNHPFSRIKLPANGSYLFVHNRNVETYEFRWQGWWLTHHLTSDRPAGESQVQVQVKEEVKSQMQMQV